MSEPHVHGDLDALLDGGLEPRRKSAVEAHVASCAQCAAALGSARRMAHAVAEAPVPDPGEAYWARFADRVEQRMAPAAAPEPETAAAYERWLRWLLPPGRWGWMGTASVLVTATLVVYVGMRGYKVQPPSMPDPAARVQVPVEPPGAAPPMAAVTPVTPVPEPHAQAAPPVSKERVPPAAGTGSRPRAKAVRGAQPSSEVDALAKGQAGASAMQTEERAATLAMEDARDTKDAALVRDPVLEFARTALLGSQDAAQVQYTELARDDFRAVPSGDAVWLRAWDDTPAPQAGLLRLDELPVPAPAAKTNARRELAAGKSAPAAGVADLERVSIPTPARLRALDGLLWPRRTRADARDGLAALTQAWQQYAPADAFARARVREIAAWLAATSPSSDEKARWDRLRSGAEER